ncbi:MAG: divergent polysaccharide deacetylase family protein [Ectothiorhodospiraceae bacterium]
MRWHRGLALALLVAVRTPAAAAEPAVAVVIDDLGADPRAGDRVAAIDAPVACAVLPHTPHARQDAERCHATGKEVLLHLPMEAQRPGPVGPGAVTLDMTPEQFRDAVTENLDSIPHVSAVNNHMGSMLTRHPGHMRWLMAVLDERGDLLFLDSRTARRTVGAQAAREAGVPALERDVFLDNRRDSDAIEAQLRELFRVAERRGTAIGIGHPHGETLAVLEQSLHELAAERGVELVGLREIHRRRDREPGQP